MIAKTLPTTRKLSLGKVDLSREREWILQHGHKYVNEWVVLGDGDLIGHSADSSDLGRHRRQSSRSGDRDTLREVR
jgi:hypothetical protein